MPGGVEVKLDAGDLRKLYADLKGVEGNLTRELRKGVRDAAKPLVAAVKSEASFSSRIPASVRTKVSFSARKTSVAIIADPSIAPEAAALNNHDKGGTFRHPVYGDGSKDRSEWTWVDQAAHPFFKGPILSHASQAEREIIAAMQAVERKAGFR